MADGLGDCMPFPRARLPPIHPSPAGWRMALAFSSAKEIVSLSVCQHDPGQLQEDSYASKDSPLPKQHPTWHPHWCVRAGKMSCQDRGQMSAVAKGKGLVWFLFPPIQRPRLAQRPDDWAEPDLRCRRMPGEAGREWDGLAPAKLQPQWLWGFSKPQSLPMSSSVHRRMCSRSRTLPYIHTNARVLTQYLDTHTDWHTCPCIPTHACMCAPRHAHTFAHSHRCHSSSGTHIHTLTHPDSTDAAPWVLTLCHSSSLSLRQTQPFPPTVLSPVWSECSVSSLQGCSL